MMTGNPGGFSVSNGRTLIHGQGSSELGPMPPLVGPNAAGQSQVFYISGNVSGLYPGSASTLNLFVQNPLGQPMTVNTITLVAGNANSSCPASMLVVATNPPVPLNTSYTINVSLSIPANTTLAGPVVPVSLATGAPDACAGTAFPLVYGGTASG
jgi:hypothetical protein